MTTASLLRRTNIAEYLLYMWQIEDLIRANNLDPAAIEKNIIARYDSLDETQRKELRQWYESLIDMMRREEVEKRGHLQINNNTLNMLVQLHQELLADPKEADYQRQFNRVLPFIVELRSKGGDTPAGELETCFNALYGLLLMRMQGKEVGQDTALALSEISSLIAMLAAKFHEEPKEEEERTNQ